MEQYQSFLAETLSKRASAVSEIVSIPLLVARSSDQPPQEVQAPELPLGDGLSRLSDRIARLVIGEFWKRCPPGSEGAAGGKTVVASFIQENLETGALQVREQTTRRVAWQASPFSILQLIVDGQRIRDAYACRTYVLLYRSLRLGQEPDS